MSARGTCCVRTRVLGGGLAAAAEQAGGLCSLCLPPRPPSRPPHFLSPPPPPPTPKKEPQHCEHTQQVTHIPPGLKATFPVVLTGRQPEARATSPGSHAVGTHLPHHGRDDPRPSRQLAESRLAARARLSVFR